MSKQTFNTKIFLEGNNTGIEVPAALVEKFNAGKRVAVVVTVNGFSYRSTIAVMGGRFLIPLSAERRTAAKVKGGDKVSVTLELDDKPREVELPGDFKSALEKNKVAFANFQTLSFSAKQRYVLPIGQAKTEETRKRRIEKAVEELAGEKK